MLIVDSHALLRFGLRSLLAAESEAHVECLEATCLADAIDTYRAHTDIDLVLIDLNVSGCCGLQGLLQFIGTFPGAQVAILNATQDEFVVRQTKAMGVAHLPKTHPPQALSEMIMSLLRFDVKANAPTSDLSVCGGRGHAARYARVAELGTRHLEILDLLLFGCSNQEVSNATNLSLSAVKNYVSTILLALDVQSRSHLISVFR